MDFTQPHEPAHQGRPDASGAATIACANLRKARAAGVKMATGPDSGSR